MLEIRVGGGAGVSEAMSFRPIIDMRLMLNAFRRVLRPSEREAGLTSSMAMRSSAGPSSKSSCDPLVAFESTLLLLLLFRPTSTSFESSAFDGG
jgi:hypothetical protein